MLCDVSRTGPVTISLPSVDIPIRKVPEVLDVTATMSLTEPVHNAAEDNVARLSGCAAEDGVARLSGSAAAS